MTKEQSHCSHTNPGQDRWVSESGNRFDIDWEEAHWEYADDISCFEDISNAQYKCAKCGLVFNYSGGNPHHKLEE